MSAEPLRWARCPEDGHLHLHLLGPTQVVVATTQGHARALCGIRLGAEGLTITNRSAALCLICLAGADPAARRPRWAVAPDDDAAHLLLPGSGRRPGAAW